MDLRMLGDTIARVSFDTGVVLLTSSGYELRIETAASIATPDHHVVSFAPASPGAGVVCLVELVHKEISAAFVSNDGRLVIRFTGGSELTVAADASYEAWSIVGSAGDRFVCMPSGEIATWTQNK